MPVRVVAEKTGVGRTTVAETFRRLAREGTLLRTRQGYEVVQPVRLLDRWLTGYIDVLRPRLVIGTYRSSANDPAEIEAEIEAALRETSFSWAWGGGTAAFRLTGYYRGRTTTLHIQSSVPASLSNLKLTPARDGEILCLRAPAPLAYSGVQPRTVHPLLVYAELMATDDERAHEAAMDIRERFLEL
jgi:hypothetical protein